jgi:DNA polymerase III subunit beta
MKVVVIKNNLKEGLSAVERAVGVNPNLPILKNVRFDAEGNKLTLTATDLEIATTFSVSGKVIEEGSLTVPISLLSSLINTIPSDRLNLEGTKDTLEVKTENYQATVRGTASDDFPLVPKIKNVGEYLEIESGILKGALEQVIVAAQFSDLRPELNSVFFNFSVNDLKIAATDSFRLAEKTLGSNQFKAKDLSPFTLLLPLRSGQELLRILKEDGSVSMFRDDNQVLFKTDQAEFFSRVMEGAFPDYKAVVPQKFDAELGVSRQEFLNALKLAGIFSTRSNEIKLKISEAKKSLEVSSADQSLGENSYLLAAKLRGSAKEAGFNWRYLSDGLKALGAEEVFFGVNDENKPAILKSPNDASYFYLLMPMLKA